MCAFKNWETLTISFWWRKLGIDVLMVLARDRFARRLALARALLECEEGEDYPGVEVVDEEEPEEEPGRQHLFGLPRIRE